MEGKSCLFLFWFVIDELMPPKKGHILNPGTCILCITLYSKRKFAHMIKLRILRWEDVPAWITQFSCACVLRDSHSQFSGNQDSLQPHGLQPPGSFPWDFPGKDNGLGAISFSRGSFPPRDRTYVSCVPCISRQILYH